MPIPDWITVQVADVGAGYATSLSSSNEGQTALVDCGDARGPRGRQAAEGLHRNAGWPWDRALDLDLSEVMVSHPHADHFNGFLRLARIWREERLDPVGHDVTFLHPRLPEQREVREFGARLYAYNAVLSGIPEFRLLDAIRSFASVTRRVPVSETQVIDLGGTTAEVLWPPRFLPVGATKVLTNAVEAYDHLAEAAAAAGDRRLVHALDNVREQQEVDRSMDPEIVDPSDLASLDQDDPWLGDLPPRLDRGVDPWDDRDAEDRARASDVDLAIERLGHAMARAANLLSVAFTTAGSQYLFLGDLDVRMHPFVVDRLHASRRGHHRIVVSAHHGTHHHERLRELDWDLAISSVGPPLSEKVKEGYDRATHLRTDRLGDITVVAHTDGETLVRLGRR